MKRILMLMCLAAFTSGCGSGNPVGPPPATTPALQERQKPEQVPPDKDYYRWFGEDDPIHPGYTPP
jgi:predicted small lipoprotein YifL